MAIVTEVAKQILSIENPDIKKLLNKHLNLNASSLPLLFTGKDIKNVHHGDEWLGKHPEGKNGQIDATPLALVFAYASQPLCDKVLTKLKAMPPQKAIELITKIANGFYSICITASKKTRQDLAAWVASLSVDHIKKIFSGNAVNILALNDPTAITYLVTALKKLNTDTLVTLFKTYSFPLPRYTGLVRLLSKTHNDEIALLLLNLVKKLPEQSLKLLVFGDSVYTCLDEYYDNLMRQICRFSPHVITKALHLLRKLPVDTVGSLLVSGENDYFNPLTPLETAFSNEKNLNPAAQAKLAMALIDLLNHDSLRWLLINAPHANSEPFLHQLTRYRIIPAIAHYLEQSELPTSKVNHSGDTALAIAEKMHSCTITSLFEGQSLHQYLHQKPRPVNMDDCTRDHFQQRIKKYPGVLATRWQGNKTLTHLAVLKKNSDVLNLLLTNGADANAKDDKQLTPLDYAIETEQLDALTVLASHPATRFTDVRNDGSLPLPYLINQSSYPLTEQIISNLREKSAGEKAQSFAAVMVQLPKSRINMAHMEACLNNAEQCGTFQSQLTHYCAESQDSVSLFILHAAELIASSNNPALLQTASDFVVNHLSTLTSHSNAVNKDSARMQLLIFLFTMPPEKLLAFVKTLHLDALQLTQLDLIVCHGLVQPLIFSRLNAKQHQVIYQALSNKDASLQSIALVHFTRSDLTLLPPALLQQYAQLLSENDLYTHSKNRLNPSIIVLTLEKALANSPVDDKKIAELLTSLTNELDLFNQSTSLLSSQELSSMLNLAKAPIIKETIHSFMVKHDDTSPIKKKLTSAFAHFDRDYPLNAEGLLREYVVAFAQNPNNVQKPTHAAAIADILAIVSPDEVQSICHNLQQALQPQFLIDSLLTTATTNTEETPNYHLSQWVISLDTATARIPLTAFVMLASQLSDEANQLATLLDASEGKSRQALQHLAKTLSTLADALIKNQFESSNPAWTEELDQALTAMQTACTTTMKWVDKKNMPVREHLPAKAIQQRLYRLLWEQASTAFPTKLKQAYLELGQQHTLKTCSLNSALQMNPPLKPLAAVFNLEVLNKEKTAIIHAHQWQAAELRQRIKTLNKNLTTGILANPQATDLLPILVDWQMSNGYLAPSIAMIKQLPLLISTFAPNVLITLSEQQESILLLAERTAPLLLQLRHLANQTSSLKDLINCLLTTDDDVLAQFVALTAKAHLHDLNRVANYVLMGKTHHWADYLGKNNAFIENTILVDTWLQKSMASLQRFTTNALSVKTLIVGLHRDDGLSETRLQTVYDLIKHHQAPLRREAIIQLSKSHEKLLTNDLYSPAAMAFVKAFNELIQQSSAQLQAKTFNRLPATIISALLTHCLSGISSGEPTRAEYCKALLPCICLHAGHGSEARLQVIKKELSQQYFELLGDDDFKQLVNDVLTEKSDLGDLTMDGVWIQRLLVSPRFVAAYPDRLLDLTTRYKALSLTLKQDEFDRLNQFIDGKLSFARQHQDAWKRWRHELLQNPEAKARLLEKLQHLLAFRADDSVRALFNQLEDECFKLQSTDPVLADKALEALYTHHNEQLMSLRSDVLFRMANFAYTKAVGHKGDIPKNQSPLLAWLGKHLPHYNFQQEELHRKTTIYLHNEKGQHIGYLDESNHAFALVNDQPAPLLQLNGWHDGSVLYDKNRQRIGVLTACGQLKHENVFRQHSSALLVSKMPIDQLEQSPAAMDLLIQDIFLENSVDTLYKGSTDEAKHTWIQQQLSKRLKSDKKPLPMDVLASIVTHHSIDSILDVIASSHNPTNAENLFAAVFLNDQKRNDLFANRASPLVAQCLKQINSEHALADFLSAHYEKPWFNQGFSLFADSAKNTAKKNLLSNALLELKGRVQNQTLSEAAFNAILATLIGSEANVKTLLNGFLSDDKRQSVQKMRSTHTDNFTRFFGEQHILPVINGLNDKPSWSNCGQYRLLLMILNAEHPHLFPRIERSASKKLAWPPQALQQISIFTTRHVHTDTPYDHNGAIGQQLLCELVFRSASAGLPALFYKKTGHLDKRITSFQLERSTLHALAARFYVVNYAKETVELFMATVKAWFGSPDNEKIIDELKENEAIIDWKELATASWAHTYDTHLPLIAAFLINYSGASAPLVTLLNDMFSHTTLMKRRDILHHVSQIMAHYPHRDVSHVIFSTLENAAIKKPELIDKTVLSNMVTFYKKVYKHENKPSEPLEAELALLTHFGQQKHYKLTRHCASLLYKPNTWGVFFKTCFGFQENDNPPINKKFGRAIIESNVEKSLQGSLGHWCFRLQKALKRWWHYGSSGTKKPTGIVKFCDNNAPYDSPEKTLFFVNTPIMNESELAPEHSSHQGVQERYQVFFNNNPSEETPEKFFSIPKFLFSGMTGIGFFAEEPQDDHFLLKDTPKLAV